MHDLVCIIHYGFHIIQQFPFAKEAELECGESGNKSKIAI